MLSNCAGINLKDVHIVVVTGDDRIVPLVVIEGLV